MHLPIHKLGNLFLLSSLLAVGCGGGSATNGRDGGNANDDGGGGGAGGSTPDSGSVVCESSNFSTVREHALPTGGFTLPSDATHCNFGNRSERIYTLTDIDGDSLPDLVVTDDCDRDEGDDTIGASHWNVYKNQGNAFAQNATAFEIPAGGFTMASDSAYCGFGNRTRRIYTLTDIDGDGLQDLVVTSDCDSEDETIGVSHWDVYKNQGNAFAQSATAFEIPAGGFPMTSDAAYCGFGNRTRRIYTLTDIDGDDLPDLVVTGNCDSEAGDPLGTSRWEVYKNQGNAFAQNATNFEIPEGDFTMPSDAGHCSYSNHTGHVYVLTDMDGDGLPDLVVTDDCDSDERDETLGESRWKVYKNQGNAFAQDAKSFQIPAGGFPMPSDADHCSYIGNRTNRTYSLTDMDGDNRPDLVLTADCDGDESVGTSHWKIYENQDDGFATTAVNLAIPAGGFPMPSDSIHCSAIGNRTDRTYGFTDMNGDNLPDLVLTGDCNADGDENVGSTHWNVYPLECIE